MHVVVLHNEVTEDCSIAARDVIIQRNAVVDALHRLGHETNCLTCDLNLGRLKSRLIDLRPDVVFNLVESLGGSDLLMAAPTLLFDAMAIPYTGCGTEAIFVTTHKLIAKERLRKNGLATPDWFSLNAPSCDSFPPFRGESTFIVKHVWEHASVDMDDDAVVQVSSCDELADLLAAREAVTERPHFAERFIDGREFNIALLAKRSEVNATPSANNHRIDVRAPVPTVLPPSEIEFREFPTDKPRIVGYRAKWEESSFEYLNTPRRFDFPPSDLPLVDEVSRLAIQCWHDFGLRGYARVDFRVDEHGRPWILELNANPCIAPDGGFASSLERAEIEYETGIARIIDDALAGRRSNAPISLGLNSC